MIFSQSAGTESWPQPPPFGPVCVPRGATHQ
ncbi:hypothetical protein SMNI109538_01290 [Smaragdicoccus niigatensis]